MSASNAVPNTDELELTLFGPGYGESIVLHVGASTWIIIDSCIDADGKPSALNYLERIGVDPAHAVELVVATHWHDDHIRGMAQIMKVCTRAAFCCAAVLCRSEFLAAVNALESRHLSSAGSGARELYGTFTHLVKIDSPPTHAIANRRIFKRASCEIWSLSPSDAAFRAFIRALGRLSENEGRTKARFSDPTPNEIAVALWVQVGDAAILLGSDLETRGWSEILRYEGRPDGKASAFKVPHHGSANGDCSEIWTRMLATDPFAVLAPWQRGGNGLPRPTDVQRILSRTANAYASAQGPALLRSRQRKNSAVDRTIRDTGYGLRRISASRGGIRLRKCIGTSDHWKVTTFGSACHLRDFVAV